jgi:hypothetical protein
LRPLVQCDIMAASEYLSEAVRTVEFLLLVIA